MRTMNYQSPKSSGASPWRNGGYAPSPTGWDAAGQVGMGPVPFNLDPSATRPSPIPWKSGGHSGALHMPLWRRRSAPAWRWGIDCTISTVSSTSTAIYARCIPRTWTSRRSLTLRFRVIVAPSQTAIEVLGHIHDCLSRAGPFQGLYLPQSPTVPERPHTVIGTEVIPSSSDPTWDMHRVAEYGIAAPLEIQVRRHGVPGRGQEKFAWCAV
jgi:hypothetical protein